MILRLIAALLPVLFLTSAFAQERFTVLQDLRSEWKVYEGGSYEVIEKMPLGGVRTVYFQVDPQLHGDDFLKVNSTKSYFLFINGEVKGEFTGASMFRIDSLLGPSSRPSWVAVHQSRIRERDLSTVIVTPRVINAAAVFAPTPRPYSHFRDFVVIAGLLIIVTFILMVRVNPKLAAEYFAISRMFTSREADETQPGLRLTGGSNIQFCILCSLIVGYYLVIVVQYLPGHYSLPMRFQADGFWMSWWQWLKLSAIVFSVLVVKAATIYGLTRLFNMTATARFHFFNWVRLLLVILGAATTALFAYYVSRGIDPEYYVIFLSVVVAVLIAWVVVASFKLSGRSGHSMFHLFSYLCATEIIPLLITVKVLFQ